MESILQQLTALDPVYIRVFLAAMRYIAPVLAGILLWRCLKSLVAFKKDLEVWGWLYGDDGSAFRLTHWENIIGRSKSCDVVVNFPTVSRNHAVLTRYDDGSWTVTDAGSKSGTLVNGKRVQIHAMRSGDVINIGGLGMRLAPSTSRQEQWMAECRVPAYNEKNGSGAVRHVFSRFAFKTGQGQVTVVSAKNKLPDTDRLIELILEKCPETKSIVLNVNKTKGNTVLSGEFFTIWGEGYIEEILCGLKFRLSPRSFLQINPVQAEKLYDKAIEYASLTGKETVIDLYCGTGTITLCLARKAGRVIGAEIVDAAIVDAKENAKRNEISNAEFICADASEAAKYLKDSGIKPDVLVVDPPRKGLAPDVIDSIAEMNPERVVYVSCDPSTLARDLKIFAEKGYEMEKGEAFDLFPRTFHVETVCLLSRK